MKNETQIRIEKAVNKIANNTVRLIEIKTSIAIHTERMKEMLKDDGESDTTINNVNDRNTRIVELEFDGELLEEQTERLGWFIEHTTKALVKTNEGLEMKLEQR